MSAAASDGVGFCGGVVALLAGLMPLRLGPGKRRRDHPGVTCPRLAAQRHPSRPAAADPRPALLLALVLPLALSFALAFSFALVLPLFHVTTVLGSSPAVPDSE